MSTDIPVADADREEKMRLCQERIGYSFRDRSLLLAALTHASGADHRLASNERLEFLGDAILGAVVCELLFGRFPEFLEGDLTRLKSVVVSRETCARLTERIGLTDCLILGRGMAHSGNLPRSLLADVFESIVAAVFLDSGYDGVRQLLLPILASEVDAVHAGLVGENHKSALQQLAQRDSGSSPAYLLLAERGPDHAKRFQVAVSLNSRRFTPAWGMNKKEAEQRAAANAIAELSSASPPFPNVGNRGADAASEPAPPDSEYSS